MKHGNRHSAHGSMLMEAVLIMPLLVILIFFLLQLCLAWGAKQMVSYAAFCGARAALVYNPTDYDAYQENDGHWQTRTLEEGGSQRGVVHQAACTVLSWVSWSLTNRINSSTNTTATGLVSDAIGRDFRIGQFTAVPLSSRIRSQVRVEVREFETIGKSDRSEEPTPIERQFPAVTVRVRFDFPLFIPLGGTIMAYFFGASRTYVDTTGAVGLAGFTAPDGATVQQYLDASGRYTRLHGMGLYSIPLEESCTMAKPYKTDTYPVMSDMERTFMGIF